MENGSFVSINAPDWSSSQNCVTVWMIYSQTRINWLGDPCTTVTSSVALKIFNDFHHLYDLNDSIQIILHMILSEALLCHFWSLALLHRERKYSTFYKMSPVEICALQWHESKLWQIFHLQLNNFSNSASLHHRIGVAVKALKHNLQYLGRV